MEAHLNGNSPAHVKSGINGAKLDFKAIEAALLARSRDYLSHLLPGGELQGHEYVVRNPTRSDGEAGSFKVNVRSGKWADFASGQSGRSLLDLAVEIGGAPLMAAAREAATWAGIDASSPAQAAGDVTLEVYAKAKKLDPAFLRSLGLETVANPYAPRQKVLAIPYRDASGEPVRMRYRVAMEGKNKTIWDRQKERGVPGLYGLERVPDSASIMLLVEGESDAQTAWSRGYAALGVPGVMTFKAERDAAALAGLDVVVLQEPGEGGEALLKRLRSLPDTSRIRVAKLDGFKDVSELHCQAPERFDAVLDAAIAGAKPLTGIEPGQRERIEIVLDVDEQARTIDETFNLIREDGTLYNRAGALVFLRGDRTIEADEYQLADYLARRVKFRRIKEGVPMPASPPSWLCKRIGKLPANLPELMGIITAPTLRPDGSLLNEPGFDAATGLLLLPGDFPHVPLKPSKEELRAAWRTLWLPYAEFPYVSDDDRGVAAAAILTALVRRILPTAPGFSFDAPCPSSGKTLLATCIAELCGGEPSVIGEAKEEDELRKKFLPALMDGQPCVLLDNVKGQFQSSALEALLTSARYSDRVLGISRNLNFASNLLLLISGNNFQPAGDLWRRILTARIDPKTENAHKRVFKLDALAHCRENRQKLVAAGLTLLRGFIAAGAPNQTPGDRTGSFEAWDALIRQCVIWLGKEGVAPVMDPAKSINKAQEHDPERQKLAAFLELTQRAMEAERWRTAALISKANNEVGTTEEGQPLRDTLLEIAGAGNIINPRILGRWIEKQADRRCNGRWVERAGIRDGNTLWKICGGDTGKEKS